MVLAVDAATILFPTGNTRLSTIVAFSAFLALAIARRSWLPIAGCLAWLFGFEAAFNATLLALGRPAALDPIHFAVYLVIGTVLPFWLARRGVKPNWWLLVAASVVWAIWMATGFHANGHTMAGFDPLAEALNEGAKTLWAAAYFVPLWKASEAIPDQIDAQAAGDGGLATGVLGSSSGSTLRQGLVEGRTANREGPQRRARRARRLRARRK